MSKRELIARELDRLPEQELECVLAFLQSLNSEPADSATTAVKARHAKDWLTPEDEAWAGL